MVEKRVDVTEYELAVLEVLWERGSATIREITEQVYRSNTPTTYATVQKLLERLEKKECVHRDRGGYAHVFSPTIDRTALIGQGLETLAEKLCHGSLTPILVHLSETTKLSAKDREMLRKLIDESD